MHTPTIVVMQTSEGGQLICRLVLGFLGLVEGRDFVILSRSPTQKLFMPGMRQLFITGSFDGMDDGLVAEMVTRVRRYNPELVVASFAAWHLDGDFDLRIKKIGGDPGKNLRNAVQGFLEGSVNRAH
ncbi:MAG: hypothetical protein WAX80_03605 [Minisyncoccia bacterium]